MTTRFPIRASAQAPPAAQADRPADGESLAGEAVLHFVEEFALQMESEGLPRMAGRIYGWLLICDPPAQSAADLARVLGASKGSISSMTALLLRAGLIERFARPGERRDYFRVRPGSMSDLLADGLRRVVAMRAMIERGLALLADAPEPARERLQDVYDVLVFFEREYPELLRRWQTSRRR